MSNKRIKIGLRVVSFFMLITLAINSFYTPKSYASSDYEQLKNSTVVYSGSSKLFSLELKSSLNRLIFKAVYNSNPTIVQSYHTVGFYFSSKKSSNGNTLGINDKYRTYVDLTGKLEDDVLQHDYRTDEIKSYDTYTFTAKQVIEALHYLYPGEDLTEPHTVYLHDVFVKKKRVTTSSPWIYDFGKTKYDGTMYRTLDQFLTMYPYYAGNDAKREEMSPYYNIPITIALKGVNVEVLCVDDSGKVLKNLGKQKLAMGDDFEYKASGTLKYSGKTYKYQKYTFDTKSGTSQNVKVDNVVKDTKLKLVYKTGDTPPPPPPPSKEETAGDLSQTANGPVSSLSLKGDYRGNEKFNVLQGIPTTESLYANVFTNQYLLDYKFVQKEGSKTYNVSVTRNYVFVNTEPYKDSKGKTKYRTVKTYGTNTQTYAIKRTYSFWEVEGFNVYTPESVRVENYALPNGGVDINAVGLIKPSVVHQKPSKHIVEPVYKNITLPTSTLYETTSYPADDWFSIADGAVGQINCINDFLSFNSTVYMSSVAQKTNAPAPSAVPVMGNLISDTVFYKSGLLIDYNKLNGTYDTEGTVNYVPSYVYGTKGKNLEGDYPINSLNSVTIHTPVVCNAIIKGSKEFNQMIKPNNSVVNLVLDRYFNVDIPTTGQHLNYLGYGYNSYHKYTFNRQVKYPFDVYYNNTFIPKNTWCDISGETTFYLPTWVTEGNYNVEFRAIALNADLYALSAQGQTNANTSISKYVATDTIAVDVSGRMYGFSVYDVSDYPVWESVFRENGSLDLTDNLYRVGLRNRNGVLVKDNALYTLPIMSGSHPTKKAQTIGTGYVFRYNLYTIGNMYDDKDAIEITPTFYYVSKDGKTRTEVDIYYTETFNKQVNELVKVGSELDKTNKKKLSLGNNYTSVPLVELEKTASLMNSTVKEMKATSSKAYTFSHILLDYKLRTFVGSSTNIPSSVDANIAQKSVQKWYGEYYLPSTVHVVKKGYDVAAYASSHSIDYKESFWLGSDGGYILINFTIKSINNEREYLSYYGSGSSDTCNMWNLEGFSYSKQASDGTVYYLTQGDTLMYNISNSAGDQYNAGGTH